MQQRKISVLLGRLKIVLFLSLRDQHLDTVFDDVHVTLLLDVISFTLAL